MNNNTTPSIPAIDCSLKGGYLIEASAGTGKTWTLTGIILRLLIEKKYAPEQIIATTFTRAAADEMTERIQQRIHDFYRYIVWLNHQKENYHHWFVIDEDKNIHEVMNEIVSEAKRADISEADDAIHLHLIKQLINDNDLNALSLTMRRCTLLLTTLDKLFVGTLDSLAQKWLKEYADQIGYQINTEISANSDEMTHALIHDALRHEHSQIAKSPQLYELIGREIFSDVPSLSRAVDLALNFYHAPIDKAMVIDEGYLLALERHLMAIFNKDLLVFEPFYDINVMMDFGFKKTAVCVKEFGRLNNIIANIKENKIAFIHHLSHEEIKFLNKLPDIKKESNFKKGFDDNKDKFFAMPLDELLIIVKVLHELNGVKDKYQSYLYQKIATQVRLSLKIQLEKQRKSTFTFQMVRLIEALENNAGLAEHIRHIYPVALVDESQDINGLQKRLIELIYLNELDNRRKKDKPPKGFLLLVGDPKQAIYRFRGGDVTNYNSIKNFGKSTNFPPVLNHQLTLTVNRRSNSELIDILNHWFDADNDDKFHAYLGEDIYYHHINAHHDDCLLSWQSLNRENLPDYLGNKALAILRIIHDNKDDEDKEKTDKHQYVAWHINSLLQGNHELNGKNILPNHIAVLSRSKKELREFKTYLDKLGIASVSPSEINVFTTKTAKDIYALLTAMVNQDREVLGRLLMSDLFGYSLHQLDDLLNDETKLENLVLYLKKCHERLLKYGITTALQWALSNNPLQDKNLWQISANAGERYLTDLWHLLELISREYAHQQTSEVKLLYWFEMMMRGKDDNEEYHQRILPSEVGVKLMTIHKSKGLEFPIVYVLGLDDGKGGNKNQKEIFYAYSDDEFNRRISPSKDKIFNEIMSECDFYHHKNEKELIDERLRLGYVALTRASEQVYVVVKEPPSTKDSGYRVLLKWLECPEKEIVLPPRLQNKVDLITMNDCHDMCKDKYETSEELLEWIDYHDWQAVFKKTDFVGASKTSASHLMNYINPKNLTHDNAVIDDEVELSIIQNSINYNIMDIDYVDNDIRANFEKGKHAGTFLHELLRMIDFQNIHGISECIDKLIKQLNFNISYQSKASFYKDTKHHDLAYDDNYHQALLSWTNHMITTPMLSSQASLIQLTAGQMAKEMPFSLRVTDNFSIDKLNQLFEKYKEKEIILNDDNPSLYYKYLNGSIDLVYEYGGKFYVVDYKSNFIGDKLSDYHKEYLEIVMNKSGYWLQACIYQVALHRLLKLRIKDYVGNESNYLGAVEFIFLRGVDKHYPELGHIAWQIPVSLINELDELLG